MPISKTFIHAFDALLLCGEFGAGFTIQKKVWVIHLYLCRYASRKPVLNSLDASSFVHPKQSRNFRRAAQIVDQLCVGHDHY